MEGNNMTEQYKLLFIGDIPLLYPSQSVAKQMNIEIWLDKRQLMKFLGLSNPEEEAEKKRRMYVA